MRDRYYLFSSCDRGNFRTTVRLSRSKQYHFRSYSVLSTRLHPDGTWEGRYWTPCPITSRQIYTIVLEREKEVIFIHLLSTTSRTHQPRVCGCHIHQTLTGLRVDELAKPALSPQNNKFFFLDFFFSFPHPRVPPGPRHQSSHHPLVSSISTAADNSMLHATTSNVTLVQSPRLKYCKLTVRDTTTAGSKSPQLPQKSICFARACRCMPSSNTYFVCV